MSRRTTRVSLGALLFASAASVSCGTTHEDVAANDVPLTFEEYKEHYARLAGNGQWYVEEDLPIGSEQDLYRYYTRIVLGDQPSECGPNQVCQRSTVKNIGGRDKTWRVHEKLALSYCIGTFDNQAQIDKVEAALDNATRQWELAADVNFVHLSHLDGPGCEPGKDGAVFRVRRGVQADCGDDDCPRAQAFFPDSSTANRELLYFGGALSTGGQEFLGITLHELGHVLGLWHEHARFDQGGADSACQDSIGTPDKWRGVTGGDSLSVMGYGFCNGMSFDNKDRKLSYLDRTGLRYLYTLPKVHGRLAGNAFSQANSFLDKGVGDDVFWFTPYETTFTLWRSHTSGFDMAFDSIVDCPRAGKSLVASESGGTYTFGIGEHDPKAECYPERMSDRWRPFGLRWLGTEDANLNRELFMYGQGEADTDSFFLNRNDGIFERHDLSVSGNYYPLVGAFNGEKANFAATEILWFGPGDAPDSLWQPDGELVVKSTAVVEDDYLKPARNNYDAVVGSFGLGASHGDEIFWYRGGGCYAEIWRGDGNSGFDSYIVDLTVFMNGCMRQHVPLLGDFDGDNRGDIFWYGEGDVKDVLWLIPDSLWELGQNNVFTQVDKEVKGLYRPFVGDFNGDYISDIFWYRSGGTSSIWLFKDGGEHNSVTVSTPGDFSPIPERFNEDGCTDILWYDAVYGVVRKWASNCDGTFQDQDYAVAPQKGYPVGYGPTR